MDTVTIEIIENIDEVTIEVTDQVDEVTITVAEYAPPPSPVTFLDYTEDFHFVSTDYIDMFLLNLEANSHYIFKMRLWYGVGGNDISVQPDIKSGLSDMVNNDLGFQIMGQSNPAGTVPYDWNLGQYRRLNGNGYLAGHIAELFGFIRTGAEAGVITWQVKQSDADANGANIWAGSSLELRKIQ